MTKASRPGTAGSERQKGNQPGAESGTPSSPTRYRLQHWLAMAGVGSRRHCEEYILSGRVTVNGQTVTELGSQIDPQTCDVRLDGERVNSEKKVYYMLNKPSGVLCTANDPSGRPRVIDLFPKSLHQRLFPVGRLDENSRGLLLVTNDGEMSHYLAHPRFHVTKVYRVQVAGIPRLEVLQQLERGLHFREGKFRVEGVRRLKILGESTLLELTLTEGHNREIRRMLARVGHKVMRLVRVALGPLRLGDLPDGKFRPLTHEEVQALRELMAAGPNRRPAVKKMASEKERRRDRQLDRRIARKTSRSRGDEREIAAIDQPAGTARPGELPAKTPRQERRAMDKQFAQARLQAQSGRPGEETAASRRGQRGPQLRGKKGPAAKGGPRPFNPRGPSPRGVQVRAAAQREHELFDEDDEESFVPQGQHPAVASRPRGKRKPEVEQRFTRIEHMSDVGPGEQQSAEQRDTSHVIKPRPKRASGQRAGQGQGEVPARSQGARPGKKSGTRSAGRAGSRPQSGSRKASFSKSPRTAPPQPPLPEEF